MASAVNKLSAAKLAKLDKPGLYGDGGGLYLQVSRWGTKAWIFRYTLDGRSRYMGLGPLAAFTLAEARDRARKARQMVVDGLDPIEEKHAKRAAKRVAAANRVTFRQASEGYIADQKAGWSAKHTHQWTASLEAHVWPLIGDLAVDAVDGEIVLKVVKPMWNEKTVTADRVRNRIELVLDWATALKFRSGLENPARWRGHLDKLLPARRKVAKVKHLAAMPYRDVPAFMARLRAMNGIAHRALEFTILTAVRTSEAVNATWQEIDFATGVWTIPATRMKAGREHRVALSDRALAILQALSQEASGGFVFPGLGKDLPLSDKVMRKTLRGMDDTATVHGFRSAFRDWAGEATNFPREVAEAALAHRVGDATENSYRRGDALEKRGRLMEAWARYCAENAAEGGKVVPMQGRA